MLLLLVFSQIALASYPKDLTTYPYEGKKADFLVGVLGGTGCKRHWDVLDTHDAHHLEPFDKCGKYVMVSHRYHKWVDSSKYKNTDWKILAWPIKGDGVLEEARCSNNSNKTYKLVQYEECGGEGKILSYCSEDGESILDCNE